MKIYTKTGDTGTTALLGGVRVSKSHPRIESYGTVDELNSAIGLARGLGLPGEVDEVVLQIQHQLFELGSQLATPSAAGDSKEWVTAASITAIEEAIDEFEKGLPELREFILPAGTSASAALHLARTVCRRAERCVVTLAELPEEHVADDAIVYLNRIGDLMFVLARYVNQAAGCQDEAWKKPQ